MMILIVSLTEERSQSDRGTRRMKNLGEKFDKMIIAVKMIMSDVRDIKHALGTQDCRR